MFGGQHSPSVLSPSRAEPDVRSLSADLSSWEEYQEQSHNITLRPSLSLSLALSRYILRVVSRSFLASSSLVTGPRARCQAEISWPGVHRNLRLYLTFCHINTAVITKRKQGIATTTDTDEYSFISHQTPTGVVDVTIGS